MAFWGDGGSRHNEILVTAVSRTTLVNTGETSYIPRMEAIDPAIDSDAFVCQLSTNDATKEMPLGTVSDGWELSDFDTQTVAGSIEYIICYATQTWGCPVVFYTNPVYDSKNYAAMVALLQEIRDKWGIAVIDLWNDAEFNQINDEQRSLYMIDKIHPSKAGYLLWWLPEFEEALESVLS